MLSLEFPKRSAAKYRVLCLGAHSDDIEIGCGGTILKLAAAYPTAEFQWVVFSADKRRAAEAKKSFGCFLRKARSKKIVIKNFRESFFPYVGDVIKEYFEQLKFSPDLILTHNRNDLHQDHHLISELTWNTFRNHLILEYEIPKYDGDLGSPNVFVPLEEAICRRKIDYIITSFKSQRHRHWFEAETFQSLLRLRGMESGTKYAEAFYGRKMILGLSGGD